ncbi:MAG: YicC/YloC family endoribonuclease [Acidiferrobacterales bacterium]
MALSMTSYARCEQDTQWGKLVSELRSVNHRYLEVALRLPEELRAMEPQMRELLGKRLGRGKVDCILRLQAQENAPPEFAPDDALVGRLIAVGRKFERIAAENSTSVQPLRVIDILCWPGALRNAGPDSEALGSESLKLLERTVIEMIATRRREGEHLADVMRQRLDAMEGIVQAVRGWLPEVLQNFRERLTTRLADLRSEVDASRIEQEIVLFAQRIDVDEELDRLTVHLTEVRRVLGQEGQIGRRLDFLMQEFNREANTLGSKAADVRLTNAAVDLKVLIEQMREQVQNIE